MIVKLETSQFVTPVFLPPGADLEASGTSGSESWTHLLCPPSETEGTGTGTSVNQPVPPANHPVPSPGEEAGPANRALPVVLYPYQPDEVIGGFCSFHPAETLGQIRLPFLQGHRNGPNQSRRPI
ncbi:hypothetical protein REPUB_Repub04eG0032500 [Reevesia pubescens]